ncbi:MAG: vitamin K epoxide reductase family protein [Gemmatimonadales bacterium]|jgi:uncharacterized membrane protein
MKHLTRVLLLTLLCLVWPAGTLGTSAVVQGPVVRALLFFSPTCPHCHEVINKDLPVIFQRFGGEARVWFDQERPRDQVALYLVTNGQVEILLVDASIAGGNELYMASQEALNIPNNRRGVPRLVVGDHVLVGSLEIPEIFPGIVEEGLAAGGIDWPDIAGMDQALAAFPWLQPLAAAEAPDEPAADEPAPESATEPVSHDGEGAAAEETLPDAGDAADRSPESADRGSKPDSEEAERDPEPGAETDPGPAAMPGAEVAAADGPTDGGGAPEDSAAAAVEPGDASPAAEKTPAEGGPAVAETGVGEADLSMISARRPNMIELYSRDPVGNSFSVLVLIGMMVSLFAVYGMSREPMTAGREFGLAIPLLSLLGIVVASYLAYIESTGAEAVCGPVGDCNTVNQSEYAILFGVLPVGVLGLAGYVAIIAAWLTARRGDGRASDWAKVALLGMTLFGTLFSIYLTFLEPFVIGATCAWCLTSAVVMTLLMIITARPAFGALDRLRASQPF